MKIPNTLRKIGIGNRRKAKRKYEKIERNKRIAGEVRELTKQMRIATINGDLDWMRRDKLKKETDDGLRENDLRVNSCS